MRNFVRGALGAALLAGTVGLAGCADASTTEHQPVSTPAGSPAPPSGPTTGPGASLDPDAAAAAARDDDTPSGLTVRYVDDDGRFVTIEPQDFPR